MSKSSQRSHDQIINAVLEAVTLDHGETDTKAYYDPHYVNQRERARAIIGRMPFTEQIALAHEVHTRRYDNDDDGLEDTPLGDALEAMAHAIMVNLAFEDAPDAVQAKARGIAVTKAMADHMCEVNSLHMPDHWRDDALRTVARDMERFFAPTLRSVA